MVGDGRGGKRRGREREGAGIVKVGRAWYLELYIIRKSEHEGTNLSTNYTFNVWCICMVFAPDRCKSFVGAFELCYLLFCTLRVSNLDVTHSLTREKIFERLLHDCHICGLGPGVWGVWGVW